MQKKQSPFARLLTGVEISFLMGMSAVVAGAFGALVRAVTMLP